MKTLIRFFVIFGGVRIGAASESFRGVEPG